MNTGVSYLYYKAYKDPKRHSTGLLDNHTNRKIVEKMLEKAYFDYLGNNNKIIQQEASSDSTIFYLQDMIKLYLEAVKVKSATYQMSIKHSFKNIYSDLNFDINEKIVVKRGNTKHNIFKIEDVFKNEYFKFRAFKKSNSPLRNLQAFMNWLYNNDYLESAIKLNKYKIAEAKKKIIAYETPEIEKLLILVKSNPKQYELYLLFAFMNETGMRISESLRLEIKDIDFKNRIIYVPNKIKKTLIEELHLSKKAVELLKELVELAKLRANNKQKVFKWTESSRSRINSHLNKYLEELNIKVEMNGTHLFRKSFISKQSNKENFQIIQFMQLTRLKDIKTAQEHYNKANKKLLHNLLDND